jgi:hypothetical protein
LLFLTRIPLSSLRSLLKIVSSYLLFVMSILISLSHNSEPFVHISNSDRCFIIRTVMSILWRSKAIIINRLIYRRTMTTGL